MSTRRRRPQGELRRFRKALVAMTRDASAPAAVKAAGASIQPLQHDRRSST